MLRANHGLDGCYARSLDLSDVGPVKQWLKIVKALFNNG